MNTIYLIRHGALVEEYGRQRYLGQQEVPLSDKGRRQMEIAADFLAAAEIAAIISSPLGRCLESAEIIGKKLQLRPSVDDNFAEINLGAWDGRKREDIKAKFPREYAARGRDLKNFRPPGGGESFQDLQDRAWPAFLTTLKKHDNPLAIVTHAGVIRVIISKLQGTSLNELLTIGQDYGCINTLSADERQIFCRKINFIPKPS